MSKRPIEDVEADSRPTDDQNAKKKKRKDKSDKKSKKDKSVAVVEDVAMNGAEPEVVQELKKEKKEKKEKKDKKDKKNKDKKEPSNGVSAEVTNGATEEEASKLSKAERKAAKAAKKAAKEAKKNGTSTEASSTTTSTQATPAPISGPDGAPVSSAGYTQSSELSNLSKAEVDEYLTKHSISIQDPNSSNLRPITAFSYLPPSSLDLSKFSNPTPIQAATWPFTLSGFDCIGVAETGSGKTLAFSLPAIRHIFSLKSASSGKMSKLGVRVLVVSPTRELAIQIFEVIEKYAKEAGMEAVCLFGGVPKYEQQQKLRTANVIVATPGRLNDLVNEGSADLSKVSYLVLDEADRMLDKGFEEDVKRIMSATPTKGRQTLMFTATWPQSVRELASTFMNKPVKITIGDRDDLRANVRIKQTVEVLEQHAKEPRLLQLIKQYQSGNNKNDRILVFCLYKKEAARIENFIRAKGFRVAGIHGDLSQEKRMQALGQFKDGKCPLLVATDVAARGLDIPAVKLVINVTFPLTVEDYVHRIGRTGRAGAEGLAITFFTEHDKALSGSLVNILKAANQPVPESLLKFGTTVKKKEHSAYGAFYKDTEGAKAATKITFDD